MIKYLLSAILFLFTATSYAKIRLPNILGSNMVLQQKSTTKLWGWAEPGEKIKITTSWDNKVIENVADGNARWQLDLQTPQAGGPYSITFQGDNKIVLDNILIGEVWVCSGQSNMEWSYNQGITSIKDEFSQLNKRSIRLFNIPKTTSNTPQDDNDGNWAVCDSTTIKNFSAVGYYFGKHLNEDLDVPIGLIGSNWGGTPAEVWTPEEQVDNHAVLKEAATNNKPTAWWPVSPGYAYNAMIAPLVNYKIAGTIWYQGESNKETASSYTELINTMVGSWRKAWDKEFPFYYVQIAPFRYERHGVGALLREAQAKNLTTKNTGMVVISDLVSDTLNIHPTNKKDVGLRLANLALAETYGLKKEAYKSPMFKSLTIKGKEAILDFDDATSGLVLKGEQPKELFIAGADKVFYPATVKIKGNQILVSNKQVKTPVAVRYQFSNAGIGNIFSKNNLPVAPFRTDNWEIDTSPLK
jgi:sialate O-acetylesterase